MKKEIEYGNTNIDPSELFSQDVSMFSVIWNNHFDKNERLIPSTLIPAHVGRFTIANHPWDETFKWLADKGRGKSYQIVIPKKSENL